MNRLLLGGVVLLVLLFQTSRALASAYGIAVTGAMIIDSVLALLVLRYAPPLAALGRGRDRGPLRGHRGGAFLCANLLEAAPWRLCAGAGGGLADR